jgi:Transglycosylase-like domain
LRKQVLAAVAAAGAVAIPAAAASSTRVPPVTGHSTLSAKQASNYFPVLTAHQRLRRHKAIPRLKLSPILAEIASCESGGNPRAIGGGGAFRGKYQFDYGTWASVGGHGDPAAAPEAEQDRRAQILLARAGTSPWPVCG